jgi:hypothetical protein
MKRPNPIVPKRSGFAPLIAILAVVLSAGASYAFKEVKTKGDNMSKIVTLCDAEGDTGVCEIDGVDVGAKTEGYTNFGFFAEGTGTFTCAMKAGDHSVLSETVLANEGHTIGGQNLTDTSPIFMFTGMSAGAMWINCSAIEVANTVTIYLHMSL